MAFKILVSHKFFNDSFVAWSVPQLTAKLVARMHDVFDGVDACDRKIVREDSCTRIECVFSNSLAAIVVIHDPKDKDAAYEALYEAHCVEYAREHS